MRWNTSCARLLEHKSAKQGVAGGELEMQMGPGHSEPVCYAKECLFNPGGREAIQGFKTGKKKVEFVLEKLSILG